MRSLIPWLLTLPLLIGMAQAEDLKIPKLTASQLQWLGSQIFRNECNARIECLTAWNEGEDFPSLGIGHFIWYRQGQQEIFEETFPALLLYFQEQEIELPRWLAASGFKQPWPDRNAFLAARESDEQVALRQLLASTEAEQSAFILQRFLASVPELVDRVPATERDFIEARLQAVIDSQVPFGLYALIDYVHFKGTGLNQNERYQGQGWGLLQVLQNMSADLESPLSAFVASASAMLELRVTNAPESRNEQRWLRGWQQRLNTYLGPGQP